MCGLKVQGRARVEEAELPEKKLTTKMERSFYSCVCISDVLGFTVLTYVWGKGRRGVRGESTVALGVTREKEKKKEGFRSDF